MCSSLTDFLRNLLTSTCRIVRCKISKLQCTFLRYHFSSRSRISVQLASVKKMHSTESSFSFETMLTLQGNLFFYHVLIGPFGLMSETVYFWQSILLSTSSQGNSRRHMKHDFCISAFLISLQLKRNIAHAQLHLNAPIDDKWICAMAKNTSLFSPSSAAIECMKLSFCR